MVKKQKKAPRRKLPLEWTEESFGLPVPCQPVQAGAVCISATEFLRRQAACAGNTALQLNPPEATP